MFLSQSETFDEKALEIFEALDFDIGENSEYFKEKCNTIPNDVLITLRDKRIGNEGRTLLHNACRSGSLSAVLYLLRLGHEVQPADSGLSKITPLMDAISSNHVEIAIILVESGASLQHIDVNGENALHYTARSGSCRMAKWLIKAAGLSKDKVKEIASTTNIRLKFPEDLALNSLCKEILVNFREHGTCGSLFRIIKDNTNKMSKKKLTQLSD